jgi:hypothetical protein
MSKHVEVLMRRHYTAVGGSATGIEGRGRPEGPSRLAGNNASPPVAMVVLGADGREAVVEVVAHTGAASTRPRRI